MANRSTHLDDEGNARMVDVAAKPDSDRLAVAEGRVLLGPDAFRAVREGAAAKGDVLAIAQLAGIQGAKRTADIIPLCHPIPLDGVEVTLRLDDPDTVHIVARVHTRWRTGVEMEAMMAVAAAALTVYDMTKGMDRGVRVEGIRLVEKSGGRSGHWTVASR